MRRVGAFAAFAAGVLAAAGLVIPAAVGLTVSTVKDLDRGAEATLEARFVRANALSVRATATDTPDISVLGRPGFDGGSAGLDGPARAATPDAALADATSRTSTSLIGAFGTFGSARSASGVEVSASTVSAPVVVPTDATWTFDAQELTVTSTITATAAEVDVGLRGHQAEIDLCAGPVLSDYGAYGRVIGEHNHCGGAYVLELEVGDVVRLTGHVAGDYVVAFLKDVPKKNTPVSVLTGADLYLQTCHFTGGQMRLVALTPQVAG